MATKINNKSAISAVALGLLLAAPLASHAADWFPLKVMSLDEQSKATEVDYQPLEKASKPLKLCVSFPHMKDAFWLAANYGVVEEARRQGVAVQVLDAGGFTALNNQISQVENCVAGGGNAVILGAISEEGTANLVAELAQKNIPVIDAFNGVKSDKIAARVLTSPRNEGLRAGQFLAAQHPAGSPAVRVAWFPGPAGAGFVQLFNEGFNEAIKGSAIELVETKYGDLGKEVQSRLIEDVLQTHKNIDYIAGGAVTAEAAVPVLRARGLAGKTKVVSVYLTPGVYQNLAGGRIEASGMAPVVLTARIAVDLAVRAAEGQPLMKNVEPIGRVFAKGDAKQIPLGDALAPNGFKPVFTVK
ncbi:TMAO reductase system periplasmic protein TorT [Pseudomonas schmalbachii]|uniref:TMAO reductase system periplasmic protein TorT n=1 Tax=Pseudomonas schmalbachii TaxID=2816993 RepID=A0ABS3TTE4_9PSED|nr:TMAO reductase system periplasmic protein TorT [Pseudomonas schmalbachii]MBO3276941.1 TMAO reductase system periplasmic protein TorT [Pseudomonas schmalbachii]